jgi:hypothetical protein
MKMARAIPVLSGGTAAVLVMMAAAPALASPGRPGHSRSAGHTKITSILKSGDTVTGVRGSGGRGVVLTGSVTTSSGSQVPFLFRGRLARAAGATVSVLRPPFRQVTSATFYGPNTHLFNPRAIPRGDVRAVGSYVSSASRQGAHDQGMIYLGPLSGRGGSWRSIDVPANGRHVTGHVRACPRSRPRCFVMDTIAHSTMGNLVVGNYDLKPMVHGGLVSGNAFIYNIVRHQWTLLQMHGSLSTKTSLYGIWQDGGPGSPRYTLAGGSSARGLQRAFLINYNERTGAFGRPAFYVNNNRPTAFTHFDGITAVRGGFNLVSISNGHSPALVFVPVRGRSFGRARWSPVNVAGSAVCPCSAVTGNTVWRNHIMGLFVPNSSPVPHTYQATVRAR